jgi:hypothetical protein
VISLGARRGRTTKPSRFHPDSDFALFCFSKPEGAAFGERFGGGYCELTARAVADRGEAKGGLRPP